MFDAKLAGKVVALVGQFSGDLNKYQLCEIVDRMGGKSRLSYSGKTDVLVVGVRPGKALNQAQERGIEVWDQAQLFAEIQAYNNAAQRLPEFQFSPFESAVKRQGAHSSYIESVLGKPMLRRTHGKIVGEQHAYHMYGQAYDGYDPNIVWLQSGVETLECLVMGQVAGFMWQQFLDNVEKMPKLRALLIAESAYNRHRDQKVIDVPALLTAFPFLEYLSIEDERANLSFDVTRHASLKHLVLDVSDIKGLTMMSLPYVEYLSIPVFADANENANISDLVRQFPRLKHIRLNAECGYQIVELYLSQQHVPATIEALSLSYQTHDSTLVCNDVAALRELPIAKQLTHLAVASYDMVLPDVFGQQHMPQLSHLQITNINQRVQNIENFLEQLASVALPAGLCLDLSYNDLSSSTANHIVSLLKSQPELTALNLDGNRINAKAVRNRLEKMTCHVSLEDQQY